MSEQKQRTLAEAMAVEVLKGDMIAAFALADALLEERDVGGSPMAKAAKEMFGKRRSVGGATGINPYHWPEFRAFCQRAGIAWDLRTISMSIHIEEGFMMRIEQKYAGASPSTFIDDQVESLMPSPSESGEVQ